MQIYCQGRIKMKIKELKTKLTPELEKLLKSARENLRELRFKISRKQFKNVRELRKVKRTIARLLTILNERRINKPRPRLISKVSKPIIAQPKLEATGETLPRGENKLKKK